MTPIGAPYTDDAIFVDGQQGFLYGRQAVEKFYADDFKGWHPKNHTSTMDPLSVRMLGPDNLSRGGVWSETGKGKNCEDVPIKGYWSEIDTRQGDAWKICQLTGNLTPDSWALANPGAAVLAFGGSLRAVSSPTIDAGAAP
jgi:ketosteroid isomerase-like protein